MGNLVRVTYQVGKHEWINVLCRPSRELLEAVTGAEVWRSPRAISTCEMAHHEIEAEASMSKYKHASACKSEPNSHI
jgi:hypothetical protein